MSFRPPRIRKSKSTQFSSPGSSPTPSSNSHLFPLKTAPRVRRERDTSHLRLPILQPVFALPGGNDYTHNVPTTFTRRQAAVMNEDDVFADSAFDILDSGWSGPGSQHKKERQRNTWVEKVLPALIQPYLTLLHVSNNLRTIRRFVEREECTCQGPQSQITVICVYFQCTCLPRHHASPRLTSSIGIESVVLNTCDCSPAPKQLVSRGFFPSAPILPSLAVDVQMLQFLGELFVRIPPNNTAWTEALEAFWSHRLYKLETRVSPSFASWDAF